MSNNNKNRKRNDIEIKNEKIIDYHKCLLNQLYFSTEKTIYQINNSNW